MTEWDEDAADILKYWFAGLVDGLASLDEAARAGVLSACGRACADSYTAAVFADAWRESAGMESFLEALADRFPGADYTLISPGEIQVRYASCACDLVQKGLVKSPLLCECSASNLRENFARALGMPVEVRLEGSILGGASFCSFRVSMELLAG